MSREEMILPSGDGYSLSLKIYEAREPKAVVKCIHGMEEHQERYRPFAEFLQEAGYTVVTADMRGHGENAPVLSHIADRDGHLRLLEDEEAILAMENPAEGNWKFFVTVDQQGTTVFTDNYDDHLARVDDAINSGILNSQRGDPAQGASGGTPLDEQDPAAGEAPAPAAENPAP